MTVRTIKTEKITAKSQSLLHVLDHYVTDFKDQSILAITSKIVALCEDRVVKIGEREKPDLIAEEADYYLPPEESQYNITLTIKNNLLVPTAGIDESNADGYYVLWPADSQKTANNVRQYLVERFGLHHVGVIITDSKTGPLRYGTTGIAIAHSGFEGLKSYIGKPDIFGKPMRITKANIMDGLAVASVLVMGEGKERTPLAIIEDVPFVAFQARDPTKKELEALTISLEDDLYAPLLKRAPWRKGKRDIS